MTSRGAPRSSPFSRRSSKWREAMLTGLLVSGLCLLVRDGDHWCWISHLFQPPLQPRTVLFPVKRAPQRFSDPYVLWILGRNPCCFLANGTVIDHVQSASGHGPIVTPPLRGPKAASDLPGVALVTSVSCIALTAEHGWTRDLTSARRAASPNPKWSIARIGVD